MTSIIYKRAGSDNELHQILALQKCNMREGLSKAEIATQGFITVNHNFEILKKMNDACPHIIAISNNQVVGYALVMLPSFRNEMEILTPMFDIADSLFGDKHYIVMGQVCVAKDFRGKGVFRGMYQFYKTELQNDYACLFTEIASDNPRSLSAHKAIGFEILKTQVSNGVSWELVNWDWN